MKTLLTLTLSLFVSLSFSQTVVGTVTSSGTTFNQSGITLDFACGQPVLLDTTSNNILFDVVVVDNTVGVVELNLAPELTFYPNPTTNFLTTNTTEVNRLTVYDLTGHLVKQVEKSSTINVECLAPGTYVLVAEHNKSVSTFKFIKK